MYHNPFIPSYEVVSKSGYNIDSHGSLGNTASYLVTNDFPNYASMFYSPTEHETMSSIKYGNFEQDYSNLREIQKALNGPGIEFYVPVSVAAQDGAGRQDAKQASRIRDRLMEKINKIAMDEIIKAQKEAKAKRVRIEFEDVLLLRKRKKTVIIEDKPR